MRNIVCSDVQRASDRRVGGRVLWAANRAWIRFGQIVRAAERAFFELSAECGFHSRNYKYAYFGKLQKYI